MRTLAIDLGSKRIGLALSDEGGSLASPYGMIEARSMEADLVAVIEVIDEEEVRRVVVGLPLNMDGTVGRPAKRAAAWAKGLALRVKLPVLLVDERLSSFDADQAVMNRRKAGEHISRADKKAQIDALAAASFLQQFLDGHLSAINPE